MPVPAYIFDKTWLEGNFLIPTDKELRVELRLRLEQYGNYCIMWVPGNEEVRTVLLARVATIEAYDTSLSKTKKTKLHK